MRDASPLNDKTLAVSQLGELYKLNVLQVRREDHNPFNPAPSQHLRSGDVLLVEGSPNNLFRASEALKLESFPEWKFEDVEEMSTPEHDMVEESLSPQTSLNRQSLKQIDFIQNRFYADYVDNITEPGPAGTLSRSLVSTDAASIFKRVEISIQAHASNGIAIVAHYDCAGNPIPESEQIQQFNTCLKILSEQYSQVDVIGLWLDKDWAVHEISPSQMAS